MSALTKTELEKTSLEELGLSNGTIEPAIVEKGSQSLPIRSKRDFVTSMLTDADRLTTFGLRSNSSASLEA